MRIFNFTFDHVNCCLCNCLKYNGIMQENKLACKNSYIQDEKCIGNIKKIDVDAICTYIF